jgi:hypothetical protein
MKTLLPVLLAFLFIGCSSTHIVTMSVKQPAIVEIPQSFQHAGIVNRSQSTERNNVLERIDQVFSLEGQKLGREGALESIKGLREELESIDRFRRIIIAESDQLENPTYGVFPGPLSQESINEICIENDLDGFFSLEFYNTNTSVDYNTRKVTVEGPLGIEIPALEHLAEVTTEITTGWRIYENRSGTVLDEFITTNIVNLSGSGINPVEAAKAITGRNEAVKQVSYEIGNQYAQSILPYWIRVRRNYFVRGNDDFKVAKRRAQTGNWDGAAEIWLKETENPKGKIAGRANHNMAIINEINGDVEIAIEYARTAYENFNISESLRYLNILRERQRSLEALSRQGN